jgi:hypothetical protein
MYTFMIENGFENNVRESRLVHFEKFIYYTKQY